MDVFDWSAFTSPMIPFPTLWTQPRGASSTSHGATSFFRAILLQVSMLATPKASSGRHIPLPLLQLHDSCGKTSIGQWPTKLSANLHPCLYNLVFKRQPYSLGYIVHKPTALSRAKQCQGHQRLFLLPQPSWLQSLRTAQ